ncbi:MAG: hypothetical protein ACI4EO_02605 [Blautia sp.]
MNKRTKNSQIGTTIYRSTRIILPIVLLLFAVSVFIVIKTVNDQMNVSDDNTIIKYENGDYIYKAPEKNIVFDKETNEIYINDVLVVYTLTDLKEKEANTLAKNVDGKIVGKISGSMNVLQIKTDKSKFSDFQEKADMLMNDKNVLYATNDYPLLITDVTYPMLNIGEAVEAVNRWKNVRNLKEGHYVGENEECFVSVDVLKDSKDICHLTVNYNTKDFSESKRYDLVWNQEIYNFTQGESNSKAAEISINLNESGLDFAINDSNIAFSMTLEKDDSFNLANTVLAVKEFFAQGNYTNLEYSDKYDYNAGWYTEMWLVSVYEDNKCIYSVWVNNEQFAEPGLATVISGEDMEAIINGQIMMGDMKILEAFSVFDYYDFNPVPGENETADKKKENSSNSSEYMSFDSLAGKCFEYDDGTLLYSIEFLEESGKITANMGTFSSGGKGTCLEMFEVELKNGENSYIVDTFVSGFGVVEENNNITIIPQEDTVHVLWIDSNGKTKVDADFLSVGMNSNEQIELSDYIFDFQYNNSDYGKLVTKLNMEPAQYWQFSDAYSYVADQFYVEWKDGLFSMKNEGFNNVKLYGMQIGDRMNQVIKNLENAGWEYYSFYEDSYTYFSNINERKCMLEVRVDANDNIVYWYINNWPQGDY